MLALQHETGASFLVGHSFGGLVALEAARRNPALHKIAVYEPGVSINGSIPMSWIHGYKSKLSQKRYTMPSSSSRWAPGRIVPEIFPNG